jgi:hypothetical protein
MKAASGLSGVPPEPLILSFTQETAGARGGGRCEAGRQVVAGVRRRPLHRS